MRNHGLILPEIETHAEGVDHILGVGGLSEPIINESGDWMAFLPVGEKQNKGFETNSCTIHGTENAIEEQIIFKTGVKVNYSERYLANQAKRKGILNPNIGADPHKVAEMRRNESGTINEERAPWGGQTAEQYYSLDVMPYISEAVDWYKDWRLNHKWLWAGNPTPQEKRIRIQDALKRGTVCASVSAWYFKDGVYYKPDGTIDGHWVNITQSKDTLPYKAYDSYPESEGDFIKDLDPFYDFAVAKVYFLTPAPFLKNLYFQITDREVARLQSALVSLKYQIPHSVTNVYGTETRSAVMAFQRDNGIVDDGSHFGPKTRYALNRALDPNDFFGGSIMTYLGSLFSGV